MSEDFGGFDCITIDERTGRGHFQLPIASFLDIGDGPAFTLEVTGSLTDMALRLFGYGTWSLYWGGLGSSTSRLSLNDLPCINEQRISCQVDMHGFVRGNDYLLDASAFTKARVANVEENDNYKSDTHEKHICVMLKNGVAQVYELVSTGKNALGNVLLTQVVAPTGQSVELTWIDKATQPRLAAVSDAQGDLLQVKWQADKLSQLRVYPDTDQAMTIHAKHETDSIELALSGAGTYATKKIYRLALTGQRVEKLEVIRTYDERGDHPLTDTALFTYNKSAVASYSLLLHGQTHANRFTAAYRYADDSKHNTSTTTVTCTQGTWVDNDGTSKPHTLGKYTYVYEGGWLNSSTFEVDGSVVKTTHELSVVKHKNRSQITTTRSQDGQEDGKVTWQFDAYGNLVAYEDADTLTEWTYYNDYEVYNIKEENERVSEIDLENWLSKWHLAAVDYANPVGLGFYFFGNKGLTWYTVAHTTVTLSHTGTDYAQSAFQLPIELKYSGSSAGFSSHPESELVFVRKQGTLHAQRLNFYGYAKLTPIQQPHVNRAHVLVPSRKLTIFEPAFERTDITELQLNIAKRWAKSYVDSLKAQLKASQDEEEQRAFKEMMASLDKSLAWQSKQNSTGFKLKKPWAADAMQVEELLYETDKKKPGFGRVTANTLYALDCEGAEIASTKVITSVTYSQPQGHPRALTRLVKVVSPENEPSVSSSTLSTLTNTLLNRVDAEGTDTQWTYDKTGCLTNVKSTRAGAVVHETTHTRTQLASGYLQHEVHETGTTLASRLTVDAQGRALETSITYDGKNWLLMASADYDDLGRQCATRIFDYDAGHQCLHQLETLYTFLQDQSGHTTTSRLKDAAENVLDSKSVDITYSAHSRKAVHGNFSYATRWDPITGTLTEESGLDKANRGTLQINSVFDAQGRKTSIESRRLDVKNAALLSATQLSYSKDGLLAGVHRKAGGQSFEQTFEYDEHGRLIKQNENGLIIENRYSADNHSSLANEATLTRVSTGTNEKTSNPIVLGSQTVDALGQLRTRTVNGVVESFTASNDTSTDESPPPLKAFSSTWDNATRTLDVLCPVSYELDGKIIESLNTRTLYSLRGQILKKTDIVGQTTAFTYDAFGRVTEQVNDVCKTTFTYQDDGLLSQECIEDVGKKRTLSVHYAYDALSNEVSRTFTCPGMATHVLSRTLSADGQLTSSTLKVGNDEHSSDRYVYDAHGRLIKWSGSGKHFMFHEGAMVEQVFDYDLLGNVTRTQYIEKDWGPGTSRWSPVFERSYVPQKPGLLHKHGTQTIKSDNLGRWLGRDASFYGNGQPKKSGSFDVKDTVTYTHGYDDLGRLRSVHSSSNFSESYQFHYFAGRVYARSKVRKVDSKKPPVRDYHVLVNDSPGCYRQQRWTDGELVSSSFEMRDASGTIFASFGDGDTLEYHTYSPYGYRAFQSRSNVWLGFKGEPMLPDGTYYLGNYRLYNPEYLSFQSPDSLSPFGPGGPAAYAYCGADPINFHDPSGHQRVAQYSRKVSGTLLESKEFRYAMAAVGVMTAPFTGGTSLGLAVAVTGLALVSSGFEIASLVLEDSDPQLSQTLGYLSLGIGLSGAAVGALITGRAATRIATRSMASRSALARRPVLPGNVGRKTKGLTRFGHLSRSVNTVTLPKFHRIPQWHEVHVIGPQAKTLWGSDMAITYADVQEPLIRIARRNSMRDIYIYSGVHGDKVGNSWTSYKNASGKVTVRRDPYLNAGRFLEEDRGAYGHSIIRHRTRRLVSEGDVEFYNAIRNTNDDYRQIRQNLRKRRIHVHDMRGADGKGITVDELEALESKPGHHIGGFCYSRNDERWLHEYGLPPVISYLT